MAVRARHPRVQWRPAGGLGLRRFAPPAATQFGAHTAHLGAAQALVHGGLDERVVQDRVEHADDRPRPERRRIAPLEVAIHTWTAGQAIAFAVHRRTIDEP